MTLVEAFGHACTRLVYFICTHVIVSFSFWVSHFGVRLGTTTFNDLIGMAEGTEARDNGCRLLLDSIMRSFREKDHGAADHMAKQLLMLVDFSKLMRDRCCIALATGPTWRMRKKRSAF